MICIVHLDRDLSISFPSPKKKPTIIGYCSLPSPWLSEICLNRDIILRVANLQTHNTVAVKKEHLKPK